jgi:hypothetical protein
MNKDSVSGTEREREREFKSCLSLFINYSGYIYSDCYMHNFSYNGNTSKYILRLFPESFQLQKSQ